MSKKKSPNEIYDITTPNGYSMSGCEEMIYYIGGFYIYAIKKKNASEIRRLCTVRWYCSKSFITLQVFVSINLYNVHWFGHAKVGGSGYNKKAASLKKALNEIGWKQKYPYSAEDSFLYEYFNAIKPDTHILHMVDF